MRAPRREIRKQSGITLLELMIVVAIIGLLAGVSIPIYNNYVENGQDGAMIKSIDTMRVFQDDFRLRNGVYVAGTYDDGPDANLAPLGWDPGTDNMVFVVTRNAGVSYTVTATDSIGRSVCRVLPANDPC